MVGGTGASEGADPTSFGQGEVDVAVLGKEPTTSDGARAWRQGLPELGRRGGDREAAGNLGGGKMERGEGGGSVLYVGEGKPAMVRGGLAAASMEEEGRKERERNGQRRKTTGGWAGRHRGPSTDGGRRCRWAGEERRPEGGKGGGDGPRGGGGPEEREAEAGRMKGGRN
uniref:Uncharacterized protein n=1 Tax=Oryza glumipatula TaxID=40148 RepID=A0A0E0AHZ2_9ORYZ